MQGQLSLKTILFFTFTVMVLFSAITGGLAIYAMKQVSVSASHLSGELAEVGDASRALGQELERLFESVVMLEKGNLSEPEDGVKAALEGIEAQVQAIHDLRQGHTTPLDDSRVDLERQISGQVRAWEAVLLQSRNLRERRKLLADDTGYAEAYQATLAALTSMLEAATAREDWTATTALEDMRSQMINSNLFLGRYDREVKISETGNEWEQRKAQLALQRDALMSHHLDTSAVNTRLDASLTLANERLEKMFALARDERAHEQTIARAEGTLRTQHDAIIEVLHQLIDAGREGLDRILARSLKIVVAGLLLSVLAGLGLGWYLLRLVTRPLNECIVVADRIAGGDLGVAIGRGSSVESSRLLRAMSSMSGSLQSVVQGVIANANELLAGSSNLRQNSQQVSDTAQRQAAELSSLSKSLGKSSDDLKLSARQAHHVSESAMASSQLAAEGDSWMQRMLEAMEAINGSSGKISSVIATINEVAFKTNLLALNASVEAARAGEHGRGFAIVAAEVRNLALMSGQAAKTTQGLLEETRAKTESGRDVAEHAAASLASIVKTTRDVSSEIERISLSSSHQACAVEEINQALVKVQALVLKNAEVSAESAEGSEKLFEMSATLQALIANFRLPASANVPARGVASARGTSTRRALVAATV